MSDFKVIQGLMNEVEDFHNMNDMSDKHKFAS